MHARLVLAALAALSAPAAAQGFDLPYATDHPSQVFDWYAPTEPGAPSPSPVVVYLHGGPWDKSIIAPVPGNITDLLISNGVTVMSFNIHPHPEFEYPVQYMDAATAVQFFRANAATFGIDPQRLGFWGTSSGAITGGWLCYGPDFANPSGTAQQQQSTRPQVFLNEAGLSDFLLMAPTFPSLFPGAVFTGELAPAFLQQMSFAYMIEDVARAFTPPAVSYYGMKETPPPLLDPHDATLMKDFHDHLETFFPAVAAASQMVQKDPASQKIPYHQIAAWMLDALQVPHQLDVGYALAGTGGVEPHLVASGAWSPGGLATLSFQATQPAATPFWILAGAVALGAPFKGGTLVPVPDAVLVLQTAPGGALSLDLTLPGTMVPGQEFYLQALQPDAGAPHGWALSNGVMARIAP